MLFPVFVVCTERHQDHFPQIMSLRRTRVGIFQPAEYACQRHQASQ
jgi:hypothetical protein